MWLTGDTEKKKNKEKKKRGKVAGESSFQIPENLSALLSQAGSVPRSGPRASFQTTRTQTRCKLDLASRQTRAPVLRGPLLAFLSHLSFRPFRERQPFYYIPCRCERPATPERVHSIKRRRFDRFIIDTNRAPFCFSLMLPLHSRKH